ncbi:uncharacterized protein SCHCODRAFT_02084266 [Schizophyllum commune H4-8]|uniref:uncharacterized protein n=1 Tax=Schizophyllum commune (strain H4-8 / FGSC 9210) TaxID=578458 RepID=UPI00215EE5A8|nr:uncharacterized protein SCHCODRAFT_02084266 [Schizophyllum commune H4-8]KAI5886893.1 hypothetical protein SCHCODRAFT_02084266 [Schizophyllum commune H4-8]
MRIKGASAPQLPRPIHGIRQAIGLFRRSPDQSRAHICASRRRGSSRYLAAPLSGEPGDLCKGALSTPARGPVRVGTYPCVLGFTGKYPFRRPYTRPKTL